jgi:hypothetical protein
MEFEHIMENENEINDFGMSSEDLDKLTTGGDVVNNASKDAQAALDATADLDDSKNDDESSDDENKVSIDKSKPASESVVSEEGKLSEEEEKSAEKPKVDPKDAVIGDFRRQLRDAELKIANLEGRIQVQPVVNREERQILSPLEKAAEEQGVDVDDVEMTGKLYKEQKAFEKAQDEKAANQTFEQKIAEAERKITAEMSAEKMGEGLDLVTVTQMGTKYLTPGDRYDIALITHQHGPEAALKETYKRCGRAILNSGTQDSVVLQNAMKAKQTQSPVKPKVNKQTTVQSQENSGKDTDNGDTGIGAATPNKRLANFIAGR